CQASCGGSPWFPVREVGPGNPILSDSTGEPPPSTFNYAWDIAEISAFVLCADALAQHADTRVRGLVDGCRYWIRGYLDWVARDTQRYTAAAAAGDADDRGLIAWSADSAARG
ncbi:hypothetical protein QZM64_10560, partial [Burkholderia cepacia]|uniref:hypothetical protein n=1 Tax=Burkholderia cepacia TaxID=292 RepID=UPI0026540676